jgi:hypothetical protein
VALVVEQLRARLPRGGCAERGVQPGRARQAGPLTQRMRQSCCDVRMYTHALRLIG